MANGLGTAYCWLDNWKLLNMLLDVHLHNSQTGMDEKECKEVQMLTWLTNIYCISETLFVGRFSELRKYVVREKTVLRGFKETDCITVRNKISFAKKGTKENRNHW